MRSSTDISAAPPQSCTFLKDIPVPSDAICPLTTALPASQYTVSELGPMVFKCMLWMYAALDATQQRQPPYFVYRCFTFTVYHILWTHSTGVNLERLLMLSSFRFRIFCFTLVSRRLSPGTGKGFHKGEAVGSCGCAEEWSLSDLVRHTQSERAFD